MKFLLLFLLFLSSPISVESGPLSNILRHSLRGGIKESIKNNQNKETNSAYIEKPSFKNLDQMFLASMHRDMKLLKHVHIGNKIICI